MSAGMDGNGGECDGRLQDGRRTDSIEEFVGRTRWRRAISTLARWEGEKGRVLAAERCGMGAIMGN